jgi:shikimate dehydrogenase
MKIYGILAHPVNHSLSPQIQTAAFKNANIDAEFKRFDIAPSRLAKFIDEVRKTPIHGLAVSLPHKEEIIPLLDEVTSCSEAIKAVNTLYWKDGKLVGHNTDAIGFWNAIKDHLPKAPVKALVIGAGGAARALVYQLRHENIEVDICNRTQKKAKQLAEEFSTGVIDIETVQAAEYNLVVNSTSVGLNEEKSPLGAKQWRGFKGLAFDAVFSPLLTTFLQDAHFAGAELVTGEKMLLFQGMRQFEIWTGHKAPFEIMKTALEMSIIK